MQSPCKHDYFVTVGMIVVSLEKLFQLESLDKEEKVGEGKDKG